MTNQINLTLTADELELLYQGLEQGASNLERQRHSLMTIDNIKTDTGKDEIQSLTNKIADLNALAYRVYELSKK